MTNQNLLTNELIKHILSIFGFVDPYVENLFGITFDKYKKSKLSIEFDGLEKKSFPIFSASFSEKNSILKVIGVAIIEESDYEFCVVFQCDNMAIYGLKLNSSEDLGIFLLHKSNDGWKNPSLSEKLMACAGLELLNDSGVIWQPEPIGDFLHTCLLDLVEM